MTRSPNLDRQALDDLLRAAEVVGDWPRVTEIRYRLRTLCSNCGYEGARDHFDRNGIYAGRWHDRCATASDLSREAYRWRPGDEPLEEDGR